ncbi:MAG: hypothetical protein RSA79_04185 [Oscillospiraceae bacterium]
MEKVKSAKKLNKPLIITACIILLLIIAIVIGYVYLKPSTLFKTLNLEQSSIDKIVVKTTYLIGTNDYESSEKILTEKPEMDNVYDFLQGSKRLYSSKKEDPAYMGSYPYTIEFQFYSKDKFIKRVWFGENGGIAYLSDVSATSAENCQTLVTLFGHNYHFPNFNDFLKKTFPDNKKLPELIEENVNNK